MTTKWTDAERSSMCDIFDMHKHTQIGPWIIRSFNHIVVAFYGWRCQLIYNQQGQGKKYKPSQDFLLFKLFKIDLCDL